MLDIAQRTARFAYLVERKGQRCEQWYGLDLVNSVESISTVTDRSMTTADLMQTFQTKWEENTWNIITREVVYRDSRTKSCAGIANYGTLKYQVFSCKIWTRSDIKEISACKTYFKNIRGLKSRTLFMKAISTGKKILSLSWWQWDSIPSFEFHVAKSGCLRKWHVLQYWLKKPEHHVC